MTNDYLPATVQDFFENGETEYRYTSEGSMDNYRSMDWFVSFVELSEFIHIHRGTQVVFKHPEHEVLLQVDAGGFGNSFSHKFAVSIYEN